MTLFYIGLLTVFGIGLLLLNGCATVTTVAESALTKPSISGTVDSFESAALAIAISNRILLRSPISEEEIWPEKLYHAPTAENSVKMAVAGAGGYHGVTIPTEFDKITGFPRPTSPFYIMLKDRNQILDKELKKDYMIYFKKHPKKITCSIIKKKRDCINDLAYRNPLMAYGTIIGNNEELANLEKSVILMSKGYRECDAWVRKSKQGNIIPVACKDHGMKSEDANKALQIHKTKEEMEIARKNYSRLSKRIYQASIAGADFTVAAVIKLGTAIVKFPEALKNADNEFKGWKGVVNRQMILPRLKNLFSAIGIYKDQLDIQLTIYKTMYDQISGKFDIEDDSKTKEARSRIEHFTRAYTDIAPKLDLLARGEPVEFSPHEIATWDDLAASYQPLNEIAVYFMASLHK
jgi:hypothetical protein